jgi:hypothetical protein
MTTLPFKTSFIEAQENTKLPYDYSQYGVTIRLIHSLNTYTQDVCTCVPSGQPTEEAESERVTRALEPYSTPLLRENLYKQKELSPPSSLFLLFWVKLAD